MSNVKTFEYGIDKNNCRSLIDGFPLHREIVCTITHTEINPVNISIDIKVECLYDEVMFSTLLLMFQDTKAITFDVVDDKRLRYLHRYSAVISKVRYADNVISIGISAYSHAFIDYDAIALATTEQ